MCHPASTRHPGRPGPIIELVRLNQSRFDSEMGFLRFAEVRCRAAGRCVCQRPCGLVSVRKNRPCSRRVRAAKAGPHATGRPSGCPSQRLRSDRSPPAPPGTHRIRNVASSVLIPSILTAPTACVIRRPFTSETALSAGACRKRAASSRRCILSRCHPGEALTARYMIYRGQRFLGLFIGKSCAAKIAHRIHEVPAERNIATRLRQALKDTPGDCGLARPRGGAAIRRRTGHRGGPIPRRTPLGRTERERCGRPRPS